MKLPNNYGGITKLKGNRRKPFLARKTTGMNDKGHQIFYTIGYYESKKKALDALIEFNKKDFKDATRADITLKALYKEWFKRQSNEVSESSLEGYTTAWGHLLKIENTKVRDIRKSNIQVIVDRLKEEGYSKSAMQKVKMLAGMLFDYAMEDDIANKNYAKLVKLPRTGKTDKDIFNDVDIKNIEKAAAKEDEWANTILIMIYTGMRVGELLSLTKFNIDLDKNIITGGIKTDAGKDRIIPIHSKILPYINYWYNKNGEYLVDVNGSTLKNKVDNYRRRFYYPALKKLKIEKLSPHSCRHTFSSLMNRVGADTVSTQKIVGHADYATTANVYTHPDIEQLRKEIEKIM